MKTFNRRPPATSRITVKATGYPTLLLQTIRKYCAAKLSTVNHQLSSINDQRSTSNNQLSTFNFQLSTLTYFLLLLLTASCNSTYTSKKTGYYKIDFPEREYQVFQKAGFPYSFEYPTYAQIVQDSTYFDQDTQNPYWVNVDFPVFGARIFLSYKAIGGKSTYKVKQPDGSYKDSLGTNVFDYMVNDAFKLTSKNESVASSITDSLFRTANGVTGVFFRVGGNAATAKQFFMSDTSNHFFRGALYFDVTPNADSLRPVQNFLQKDLDHLINTFRWREK